MTDTKCLDSSAWLSYFLEENREVKKIIEEGEPIVISSLSLFEVKKKLLKLEKNPEPGIEFIKKRSTIIAPGSVIAEKAAEISIKHSLAAMDSLIYATALVSESELITADNDFRKLDNVKIIS